MTESPAPRRSSWEHALALALKPFADVRSGEAATALLLTLNVFLLLTAFILGPFCLMLLSAREQPRLLAVQHHASGALASALWLAVAVLLGNIYVKRAASPDHAAPVLQVAHGMSQTG